MTLLLKLVPPLVGAVALILTAVLDYHHRDKRTLEFKKGRIWLFAALGIFLLASPISVYVDDRNQRASAEALRNQFDSVRSQSAAQSQGLSAENTRLRSELDSLRALTTTTAVARATAEVALREKAEEIARLNRALADLVTGGNSFPYLGLVACNARSCALTLVHDGQHPLYDVAVRIVDLDVFDKVPKDAGLREYLAADTRFSVGNLSPHQVQLLGELSLGEGSSRGFNIFISARNGFIIQSLRCRRVNNAWTFATKVMRQGPTEVLLHERIDADFPRGANGEVAW
jgi:hypothetical protein